MDKKKLQEELIQSMKAHDELRTSVIRLLLSAINYYEIQKGGAGYIATEEDILSVIQKEVKQRKDSIEQFKIANRQELVDKETKELEILKTYLPEQMSEEEIKSMVQQTIKETEALTIKDMGKVMSALMGKIKGKADAGLVSKIVKESLS